METEIIRLIQEHGLQLAIASGLLTFVVALLLCGIALFRYGPAIRQLNKLEVLSQLYVLANNQRDMTLAFGSAVASSNATRLTTEQLRQDLEGLREFIAELQERLSEMNADKIAQERLEEVPEKPRGTLWSRATGVVPPPQSPEELFNGMRSEWDRFTAVFRARLVEAGIEPKMNRIGKMAYMLRDKRRSNPLPSETAELITALHSQYRRHISLQRISATEYANFVQLVKTAIEELQKKNPRIEAPTLSGGQSTQGNLPIM